MKKKSKSEGQLEETEEKDSKQSPPTRVMKE